MVQAGGDGVMVGGIFSWHTFGPLVQIEHRLNATAYLSIGADHVHPFMTTVYPSLDDYFQQDNTPCHSSNHLRLVSWTGPQSPDLNPIEHLWDVVEREIQIMDVQPTNLQQLRDAIMLIWTKISEEYFQHIVESMHEESRQKGVQPGTSKVHLIKWPVNAYSMYIYYIFFY